MNQHLLTPTEVAAWLAIPIKTLYAWRHRGRGPQALRVGRHLRYRPGDVETWLAQQASLPVPAA